MARRQRVGHFAPYHRRCIPLLARCTACYVVARIDHKSKVLSVILEWRVRVKHTRLTFTLSVILIQGTCFLPIRMDFSCTFPARKDLCACWMDIHLHEFSTPTQVSKHTAPPTTQKPQASQTRRYVAEKFWKSVMVDKPRTILPMESGRSIASEAFGAIPFRVIALSTLMFASLDRFGVT